MDAWPDPVGGRSTGEDIQERINFVAGVRKGIRELDEGKGFLHEKVREEFREWLSSWSGLPQLGLISGTFPALLQKTVPPQQNDS
jgi:hypothetical protein